MSTLTPTSRYWNWVLTEPPKPLWNDPVAIGTRSPILSEAFSLSSTRIEGLSITLVSLSVANRDQEMPGMEIEISPAVRWVRVSRVRPDPDVPVVPPGAIEAEALVGG